MGEVFAGRYEVLEVAGHGGQGEVLRARDRHHDRDVALKCRRFGPREDREAMLAEARILLNLEPHVNLPLARDDFFVGDRHVMVLDWIEGLSLSRLLAQRGDPGLAPTTVLGYLAQAADALDHLHVHQPPVVHGDVKPANLIVTGRGRVVLVDFGLATTGGGHGLGGTPGFVAPEVAAGRPPTPAADVFGLAATAFALLTGAAPSGVQADWEGIDPAVVPALERALRRGLAIDPARRPGRASELVERVRAWWAAELPTRAVTFCLTDLVGSTRLWEADSGTMAAALARHDALVARIIEDHGGRLIKSQGEGDSTLSVFSRASAAAAAALDIQSAMAAEAWPEATPLELRLALHTGEAERRGGDYFGTTLNRTARLRALAGGAQVLLSGATAAIVADHLPDGARLADLGEHALRDLARPERVFELCGPGQRSRALAPEALPAPGSAPSRSGERPPLVGRRRELGELNAALVSAIAGRGRTVLVGGEPGIGKTRLLEELAVLAGARGAKVLWGHCHEEEGAPPFWPWVRMLEDYVADCPTSALMAQLGSGVAYLVNLLPGLAQRVPDVLPPPGLDAAEARFRQFDSVARFLAAAAGTQPLVLIFEDLQWADTSTLLLLQLVGREMAPAALLVAGTYRDELTRRHPLTETLAELGRHTSTHRLVLEGLGDADVATFIALHIGRRPGPTLVEAVVRRTDGNPFFVAEVVRLLDAEGRLGEANQALVELPEGVRAVIGKRLNRLTPSTSEILALASVIGREFQVRTLGELTDRSLDEVFQALEEADAANLLNEVQGPLISYRFEHALTRQTLYEELGASRRLRLHQRVAQALERFHAGDADAHLPELAHHFVEASRLDPSEKAVDYSRRAATVALSLLAYEDAIGHYERALVSLERVTDQEGRVRSELLVELGEARAHAGQLVLARQTFIEAATAARRFAVPEALAGAALGFASVAPIQIVDKDAIDLLEAAFAALPAGDHSLTARVMARLANSLFMSDDDERVDRLSEDAVAMARRLDEPLVLAEALLHRHGSIRGPGVMPARLALADELISVARGFRSVEHEVQGLMLRTFDVLAMGDINAVDSALDQLRRLLDQVRGRWGQWGPRIMAMRALLDGDVARAEQQASEALMVGQERQDPDTLQLYGIQLANIRREQDRAAEVEPGIRNLSEQTPEVAVWRCGLVALLADQGKVTEARKLLDGLALANFDVIPTNDFRQLSLVLLADACAVIEDHQRGAAVLELLRPYAAENIVFGPALDCYGSAARPLGNLCTMLGRLDEAEAFLREALGFNTRLASQRWVARTQVDLARMLLRRDGPGDAEEAHHLLDVAHRIADALGLALTARLAIELR